MFIDSNTLILNAMVLKLADLMPQLAPEFKIAQIVPDHAAFVLAAQSAVCVLLASKPGAPMIAEHASAEPMPAAPAPEAEPAPNEPAAPRRAASKHHRQHPAKRVAKVKREPKAHRVVAAKLPKAGGKKLLQCPHCSEEFKTDGWRMRHMLKIHGTLSNVSQPEQAAP